MLVEWIFESMYNKPNRKSVIYKEKKKKKKESSILFILSQTSGIKMS